MRGSGQKQTRGPRRAGLLSDRQQKCLAQAPALPARTQVEPHYEEEVGFVQHAQQLATAHESHRPRRPPAPGPPWPPRRGHRRADPSPRTPRIVLCKLLKHADVRLSDPLHHQAITSMGPVLAPRASRRRAYLVGRQHDPPSVLFDDQRQLWVQTHQTLVGAWTRQHCVRQVVRGSHRSGQYLACARFLSLL